MTTNETKGRWTMGCLAKLPATPEGDAAYDAILATVPRTTNPTTLADFGYEYNDAGRLVQKRTQEPFAWLGQKHYDFLGDAIVNDIYAMLERNYGLRRVMLPVPPADESEPRIPIFATPDLASKDVVVLLCQGSGAVRPGMWARALCINHSLKEGAVFSYLDEIRKRGWGVVVCNPNENTVGPRPGAATATTEPMDVDAACDFWLGTSDTEWKREIATNRPPTRVRGCESPESHLCTVYRDVILPANPKMVPIVAHSYGGKCTTALVEAFFEDVAERVPAIAFTDAINDMFKMSRSSPKHIRECRALMIERSVNWVASKAPLDTPEEGFMGCREISAGHDTHEWTSAACRSSVFAFLDQRVKVFAEYEHAAHFDEPAAKK